MVFVKRQLFPHLHAQEHELTVYKNFLINIFPSSRIPYTETQLQRRAWVPFSPVRMVVPPLVGGHTPMFYLALGAYAADKFLAAHRQARIRNEDVYRRVKWYTSQY